MAVRQGTAIVTLLARLIAASCLVLAAPALGQAPVPKPIEAPADTPFAHAASGITLPVRLDGLPRAQIREYEAPQADIVANYLAPDDGAELSVYVFHVVSGSVPVWFDRATWAIENRSTFGTPIRLDRPQPFAPTGRDTANAMIAAWSLSGSDYRGTALAIVPVGDWLVKLRYTAKGLSAEALHDRLVRIVGDLALPASTAPAAVPVLACTKPIAFKANAKLAKSSSSDALMGALLSAAAAKTEGTPSSGTWCRDATSLPMGGVYRLDEATNAYFIALSDAGRGIWVEPDLGGLLTGGKAARWSISVTVPSRTLTFAARDRLLPPQEALAVLEETPTSSAATIGKSRNVTINSDAMK